MVLRLSTKARTLAAGASLVVAGCAHVPFDAPRAATQALPASATNAGAVSRSLGLTPSAPSAYIELTDGTDALGARLRMIEAAEHSIDIATFLVKPDTATSILMHRLLDAAERGVRVRLLVDDVFTTADDEDLAVLDSHPNFSVRIFNPSSRNAPKAMGFVLDFARVNRRMHIKTFVVDNSMAIVGGRNFADEYYRLNPTEEFADYDLAVFGAEAQELNPVFDTFWNDPLSLPVAALRPKTAPPLPPLSRSDWYYNPNSAAVAAYAKALSTPYLKQVAAGDKKPFRGHSEIIADTPDKLRNPNGQGPHILGDAFFSALGQAQKQITLITPYFVPEDYGARFYAQMAEKGVKVRVVTNSLSSTNHAYVHGGHARHRPALLAAGVEIFELRADAAQALGLLPAESATRITLHTKLAIIDERSVLVGSLNLDPRSIKTNAEIGMLVHSPAYARTQLQRLEQGLADFSYQVQPAASLRSEDGGTDALQWHYAPTKQGVPHQRLTQEPDASLWRKFMAAAPQWFGLEFLL